MSQEQGPQEYKPGKQFEPRQVKGWENQSKRGALNLKLLLKALNENSFYESLADELGEYTPQDLLSGYKEHLIVLKQRLERGQFSLAEEEEDLEDEIKDVAEVIVWLEGAVAAIKADVNQAAQEDWFSKELKVLNQEGSDLARTLAEGWNKVKQYQWTIEQKQALLNSMVAHWIVRQPFDKEPSVVAEVNKVNSLIERWLH